MAAAALARGEEVDAESLCARGLEDRNFPAEHAPRLAGIMAETWPMIAREGRKMLPRRRAL